MDKSHLTNIERKQLHPKSLFEFPTTSAMDYGWDTEPLVRNLLLLRCFRQFATPERTDTLTLGLTFP